MGGTSEGDSVGVEGTRPSTSEDGVAFSDGEDSMVGDEFTVGTSPYVGNVGVAGWVSVVGTETDGGE